MLCLHLLELIGFCLCHTTFLQLERLISFLKDVFALGHQGVPVLILSQHICTVWHLARVKVVRSLSRVRVGFCRLLAASWLVLGHRRVDLVGCTSVCVILTNASQVLINVCSAPKLRQESGVDGLGRRHQLLH